MDDPFFPLILLRHLMATLCHIDATPPAPSHYWTCGSHARHQVRTTASNAARLLLTIVQDVSRFSAWPVMPQMYQQAHIRKRGVA